MEEKIQKLMKSLNISRDEAIELMEEDKRIDRGEKLYELDPELEKGAKKARQADRKANTTTKREKKPKPEKEEICSAMMDGLRELGVENFEIINPEREFIFHKDGTKYKVTLACPRK
jgi:lipoate-protein ligase A